MKKPVNIFQFSIKNQTEDSVDIYIDGDIVDASTQAFIKAYFGDNTTTSYKSFRDTLDKINSKVYNVYINSLGGHVGDALAIYDHIIELRGKGKKVKTYGKGIVASSATLVLLAGEEPEMSENSWFMMHTVSGGVYGNVDQIENYSRTMRKFNDSIRDLYSTKSGMRKEEVTKLMEAETWLTAKDAKTKGFVKVVGETVKFENKIDKEKFVEFYSNEAVLNSYNGDVKPDSQTDQNEDMKKFWKDLATEIQNALKGVKPVAATADPIADQQTLINNMAAAVAKPFENLDATMEPILTAAIKAAIDALPKPVIDAAALQVAVDAAVAPFKKQITDLETANADLEQEIADKLGSESKIKDKNKDKNKIIGSFQEK